MRSGANVQEPKLDYYDKPFKAQRTIGAIESDSIYPIINVTSLQLSLNSTTLNVADTLTLFANILPDNASNKSVTWFSSNPNVASISQDGFVEALKQGNCEIVATTVDGGFKEVCTVIVQTPNSAGEVKENFAISVFPNPVSEYLIIRTNQKNGKIEISSTLGLKVIETEWREKIDVSGLIAGVYFAKVGNQIIKFIKT